MKPDLVSGSLLWQAVFLSFATVLMLFQIVRGWRLGLPRQMVRIAAVVTAYAAALWGGAALLPLLRPLIKAPDFVLSAFGGAILAMIVYAAISSVGAILFKRTAQQGTGVLRWVYGASGAFLGLFFGLFFIWLMVVSIRTLGAIAEAEVNARAPGSVPPFEERLARPARPRAAVPRTVTNVPDQESLTFSLARLKKSIELGTVGEVVKQADVLPGGVYETLGKVGEIFANPERASRFLSYPGVTQLVDHPRLLALRADPEITNMIQEGRLLELLQDERLIEAANDPELARQVKSFDLRKALDYAAQSE